MDKVNWLAVAMFVMTICYLKVIHSRDNEIRELEGLLVNVAEICGYVKPAKAEG